MKYCNACKCELLPNVNWANSEQVYNINKCRSCKLAYQTEWRKRNPGDFRKRKYGLSQEDFDTLLQKQDYKCAICKKDTPGGRYGWHVDHNHTTGKTRGLLCWLCNSGIGRFKDSKELLKEAAKYLKEHDENI